MLHPTREFFTPSTPGVRSNTRYVHHVVTPSATWQLNCRPHRGIKGCGDHTIVWGGVLDTRE